MSDQPALAQSLAQSLREASLTVRYGSTEYSIAPIQWRVGEGLFTSRLAIDHAPSGAQYMRMASEAENAMLDRIAELEAGDLDQRQLSRLRVFAAKVAESKADTPGKRAAAKYALTGSLEGAVDEMRETASGEG